MKTSLRSITATLFYITGITCALLITGVDTQNMDNFSKLFCCFLLSFGIALTLTYLDKIRRITYPTLICICAWGYKNKIVLTRFTRNAYRIYKLKNKSYVKLYDYVQDLFDATYSQEIA